MIEIPPEVPHQLDDLFGTNDVASLRNLRLTSKLFSQAATHALFKSSTVRWPCQITYESKPSSRFSDLNKALSSAFTTPTHGLLPLIKNLEVSFSQDNKDQFTVQGPAGTKDKERCQESREILGKLPVALGNLLKLESFCFRIGWWECEYDGSGPGSAPELDLQLLTSTIHNVAIGISALSFLTCLDLALPCTHNFVELSNLVPVAVFSGLRQLHMEITDATGPGGSKDYLIWADEDGDNDEEVSFSNLQQQYPNVEHAHGLFDIVEKCGNLQHLSIKGSQFLDGNLLHWTPASIGLQSVFLSRVKINSENLIKLLSPGMGMVLQSSPLSKVFLSDVDLTAGTWASVFEHLSLCPELSYLKPEDLSYTRDGESSDLKEFPGRAWEDCANLWSRNEEDEEELIRLVKILVKRAGGRHKYPSEGLDQCMLPEDEDDDDSGSNN
ncbi:hypothetical protein LOCC1_G004641 [Lachnellula occidentalis]|uniref:Uncharacterized protein n=1 Tax=Lachnellula occidentalis TaxID=215460 RepID=A0A8H8RWB9_9HELO|nr:hypothetical protein LOCC1_G004641 [Lachnellula occidentalis]